MPSLPPAVTTARLASLLWNSIMNRVSPYIHHVCGMWHSLNDPGENLGLPAVLRGEGLARAWRRCQVRTAIFNKTNHYDRMIIFYFRCVDWHPHKGIVVSGSKDNQQPIKLWDPKSGQVWHCGSSMDAVYLLFCSPGSHDDPCAQIYSHGLRLESKRQLAHHCQQRSLA